jgi:hypothetical protein
VLQCPPHHEGQRIASRCLEQRAHFGVAGRGKVRVPQAYPVKRLRRIDIPAIVYVMDKLFGQLDTRLAAIEKALHNTFPIHPASAHNLFSLPGILYRH